MATRTGVELYPDGCRLVEVQVSKGRDATADVRVRAFVAAAGDGAEPSTVAEALAGLRRTHRLSPRAWVVVWGLRSTQQLLRLPPARPADLEALALREARKDIGPLEAGGAGASVVVMPGAEVQVGPHRRREVSLVAVSSAEVRDHIQPLVDAGFVVEGVVTPALALAALARARRGGVAGSTNAYVAVGCRASCLAVIRDGLLLFAREMSWGHGSEAPDEGVNARMAAELRRSVLYFKQTFRSPVESLVLCGDMPDLRSLTQPLGAALGVPVETLDSLAGIDAGAIPEPAVEFRARVAALRIAIATAAEAAPAANLLPPAIRKVREFRRNALRAGAGLAAGLLLAGGWWVAASGRTGTYRLEAAAIAREVAALEPESARRSERRALHAASAARQATLTAFDVQGPRLARLLEAIADAANSVTVTSIAASADGAAWRVTVAGIAVADDAAAGQASVQRFLERLSESPFAGVPAGRPSLRVVTGAAGQAREAAVPDGMSGVEFSIDLMVPR